MLRNFFGLVLFLILLTQSTFGESTAKFPFVFKIDGKSTKITPKKGQERLAKEKDELQVGDSIKTNSDSFAELVYPDQSKVFVGKNTTFVILENKDGIQHNELMLGRVRAQITKVNNSKPHFMINSKTVTLGVRGTDFVMSTNGTVTGEARVIEGTVDVSHDEASIIQGKGKPLRSGELVRASDKGIGAPQKFEVRKYLSELENGNFGLTSYRAEPRDRPAQFRATGFYISQPKTKGYDFSLEFSWDPRFYATDLLGFGLHAGLFPLHIGSPTSWILGYSIGLAGDVKVTDRLKFELILGRQDWGSYTQAGMEYGANARFKMDQSGLVKAIVVGAMYYDRPSVPYDPALEMKVGVETLF